jgi:hypothetical protein
MKNTIGSEGCACGDYESENLVVTASCRKSGNHTCSEGISHKLEYRLTGVGLLNDEGFKELGEVVDRMFDWGGDCVILIKKQE